MNDRQGFTPPGSPPAWRRFEVTTGVMTDLGAEDLRSLDPAWKGRVSSDQMPDGDLDFALALLVRDALSSSLDTSGSPRPQVALDGLAVDYFKEGLLGRTRVPVLASPPSDWKTLAATTVPSGASITGLYFTDPTVMVIGVTLGANLLYLIMRSRTGGAVDRGLANLVSDYLAHVRDEKQRKRRSDQP